MVEGRGQLVPRWSFCSSGERSRDARNARSPLPLLGDWRVGCGCWAGGVWKVCRFLPRGETQGIAEISTRVSAPVGKNWLPPLVLVIKPTLDLPSGSKARVVDP